MTGFRGQAAFLSWRQSSPVKAANTRPLPITEAESQEGINIATLIPWETTADSH
jgi:hypothetical protein